MVLSNNLYTKILISCCFFVLLVNWLVRCLLCCLAIARSIVGLICVSFCYAQNTHKLDANLSLAHQLQLRVSVSHRVILTVQSLTHQQFFDLVEDISLVSLSMKKCKKIKIDA